jgi:hypothetical protein
MNVILESEGNGLLPGRILFSGGYLGHKVFMVDSSRSCGGKTYIGPMIQYAVVLATLLIIRGVGLNPGPVDNIVQVACSGCNRTLMLGTQCDRCGQWFHNSCGNVKIQVAESRKWTCVSCKYERL